jgi:uncharacterized protein
VPVKKTFKMSGESNLNKLLKKMDPVLSDGRFVFLTIKEKIPSSLAEESLMIFKENEGKTFIVKEKVAIDNQLKFEQVWSLITLNVHSDLQAIGFLAAITRKLAEAGICVNAVSAYYHDHLIVPWEKRHEAMSILKSFNSISLS